MTAARDADVIVVGGGPAGSVAAWALSRKGIRTLVLERARFPREKVCGDYVDPRGLRILEAMGCLPGLERRQATPISRTATWVEWARSYDGPIPFYGNKARFLDHGYTIPRDELDNAMLEAAAASGADVHEQTDVVEAQCTAKGVHVTARTGRRTVHYRSQLIVGADGVNSIVARGQGLLVNDPRRIAVARRAYALVEPQDEYPDKTDVFFSEALSPGYGWMFPIADGRVNLGIGVLSEAQKRAGARVPAAFDIFVDGLRRHHPSCNHLELASRPIGGIVKTYGSAGCNRFDGGVLVGDAGCFVDPMTGEGITPGMESALLASHALATALERGQYDARGLRSYEERFRAYFDSWMLFLDFFAQLLRNPHLARPLLRTLDLGCQLAQQDSDFARSSSGYFGDLEPRPIATMGTIWWRAVEELLLWWPRLAAVAAGRNRVASASPRDLVDWNRALTRSLFADPRWHTAWSLELHRQWARFILAERRSRERRAARELVSRLSDPQPETA